MLGQLNEKKALVYFASGLRLNGIDNQAQLQATTNAAIRANVSFYPVDARGLVAQSPMGDATQGSPGGVGMYSGASAMAITNNFQRSQDTLYALAADTGGKALLDNNDLSQGMVQAQKAITSYYIIGYYSTNTALDGKFRRIKITLADASLQAGLPAGILCRQGVQEVHHGGQRAAADGRADAGRPDHGTDDRDGGELLPVELGGVFRPGGGEDSGQRTGAGAQGRRGTHADRFHRRGEGRVQRRRWRMCATRWISS